MVTLTSKKVLFFATLCSWSSLGSIAAFAAPNSVEINVFGEDCTWTADLPKAAIKAAHEISPAKNKIIETPQEAAEISKRLELAKDFPPQLADYYKKFKTYAQGMHAFFTNYKLASKDFAAFAKAIDPYISNKDLSELKKLAAKKGVTRDQMLEGFKKVAIPYDYDEVSKEFFSTTEQLKFVLKCKPSQYDEGEGEEGQE